MATTLAAFIVAPSAALASAPSQVAPVDQASVPNGPVTFTAQDSSPYTAYLHLQISSSAQTNADGTLTNPDDYNGPIFGTGTQFSGSWTPASLSAQPVYWVVFGYDCSTYPCANVASPVRTLNVAADYQPEPGVQIVDGGTGTCEAGSDSVGNAYRCFAGNNVYDPCWTDNADPSTPAVLCQHSPWDKSVTRLTDSEGGLMPFFSPTLEPVTSMAPWAVQLTTGERCVAAQGAHDSFDGKKYIVDYGCVTKKGRAENRVLLRGIVRSHGRWTIRSATYDKSFAYKLGRAVRIATAWYAMQDLGDQLAAAANTCSASALAFTAAAYEEANHEPDGPLPDITQQACSGGYAILNFQQTAPPPGYQASMAFQATASGWTFLGEADYIQQGEFGIPDDAYNQIMSQLSAESATESVVF